MLAAPRVSVPMPPLIWLTCGLLCGQLVGSHLPPLVAAIIGIPPAAAALASRRALLRGPGIAVLAWTLGTVQVYAQAHPDLRAPHIAAASGSAIALRAQVVTWMPIAVRRQRVLLDVDEARHGADWTPASGRVSITVERTTQEWRPGDRLEARVRLRRPRNFGNPGEFDYEGFLARRQVYVTGYAASDASWQRLSDAAAFPLGWLDTWRSDIGRAIDATLTGPSAQVVGALLIGNTSALEPPLQTRYARAGINHVLSISGLHIGLVAAFAYGAVRWLCARSEWLLLRASVPKLTVLVAAVPVLLYAGIAGSNVATVRSVLMLLLFGTATVVDRSRDWLANVAAAALGISLVSPGAIAEISFQLSFVAVISIIVGMRRWAAWWADWEDRHLIRLRGRHWRWVRWFVLYQAASLCAVAGTAPLTAWHFNLISLVAPLANTLIVPLLGLVPVSVGLLAAVAVPIVPAGATALLTVVGALVGVADWLTAVAAAWPGAAVRVCTPSLPELAAIYSLLAAVVLRPGRGRMLVAYGAAAVLLVDAGWWYGERFHRRELQVTFLSVGHGDSAVIEFPGSEVMVIDGGGLSNTFDTGERLVARYLWQRKIQRVDFVVVTHPDFDHYGGLEFLVREFRPREVWSNGSPATGPRFAAFWAAVREAAGRTVVVGRGYQRQIGGVDIVAFGPTAEPAGGENDRSVILRLQFGPTGLLFPGDVERDGEARLIAASPAELQSTVLKVPHHGSRTSSTAGFLAAVDPRLAIVSVGYEDRYGLPHAEVLSAYRRRSCLLRRTDDDGAVIVRVDSRGTVRMRAQRDRGWTRVSARASS